MAVELDTVFAVVVDDSKSPAESFVNPQIVRSYHVYANAVAAYEYELERQKKSNDPKAVSLVVSLIREVEY